MNFRRKGEQKYMKKRIVFELAAGLLLSDAIYASVKRKWLPSVLFLFFIVMVQFGQRYGSNDEEPGYRKENINE
mgnify:CR=1 FL=1